jgi:hypothetical protein
MIYVLIDGLLERMYESTGADPSHVFVSSRVHYILLADIWECTNFRGGWHGQWLAEGGNHFVNQTTGKLMHVVVAANECDVAFGNAHGVNLDLGFTSNLDCDFEELKRQADKTHKIIADIEADPRVHRRVGCC